MFKKKAYDSQTTNRELRIKTFTIHMLFSLHSSTSSKLRNCHLIDKKKRCSVVRNVYFCLNQQLMHSSNIVFLSFPFKCNLKP